MALPFLTKQANETNRTWSFFLPLIVLITTPLLFYSQVIWEHALFTALVVWSLVLLQKEKNYWILFGGLLMGLSVGLRPESMLFLAAILILFWKNTPLIISGVIAGIIPVLLLQHYATGSILPVQWTENLGLGHYDFKGILTNFSVLLGFNHFFNIPGFIITPLLIIGFFLTNNRRISLAIIALTGIGLIYLYLIVHQFISPTHPNVLASDTGLLGCCPVIAFWWLLKSGSEFEKKMKWLTGGVIVVTILINPVAVGVHYSPRFLLPAVVIASSFLLNQIPGQTKGMQKYAVYFLLIISVLFQIQSMKTQYELRKSNTVMRRIIAENVNTPLVLSFWYQAGDLGPDMDNYTALHPGNYYGWQSIIEIFHRERITSFWRLSREFSSPVQNLPVKPTGKEFHGKYWQLKEYTLK